MPVTICGVEPGSPAAKGGIRPGDQLLSVGGHPIRDLLDYRFYTTERQVELCLCRAGTPLPPVTVRKGQYDDLGLQFETYLMDKHHSCKNKCVFCFIDQLPGGLRESLYFKDDDDRLSFLFGNYITLTNLGPEDIDRIIQMHISPINVSVHTTNPALRVRMMKNPAAGPTLAYLQRLTQGGIKVNTQLVLCPGLNDGEELRRSLTDLGSLGENLQSIAAVPVGLSDHREGLEALRPFTPEEAGAVIDLVDQFGQEFLARYGTRKAYPADEFYLEAQRPIPPAAYYGDFDQLEDGVGLMASMERDLLDALEDAPVALEAPRTVSVATGAAAGLYLSRLAETVCSRVEGLTVAVYPIPNRLFGSLITVAGLVTGGDIVHHLEGRDLGDQLLIPTCMLRHEGDLFLDDTTPEEVGQKLAVPVKPVEVDGYALLDALLGR